MQYKLLPPSYALCTVTDWLAFNQRGVMCVCMSLCGWANVGVRVGACACEVCMRFCLRAWSFTARGVDTMFLLRMVNSRCRSVSRYSLSGPIASVPMTNERICDLVLQRIAVRLV